MIAIMSNIYIMMNFNEIIGIRINKGFYGFRVLFLVLIISLNLGLAK